MAYPPLMAILAMGMPRVRGVIVMLMLVVGMFMGRSVASVVVLLAQENHRDPDVRIIFSWQGYY